MTCCDVQRYGLPIKWLLSNIMRFIAWTCHGAVTELFQTFVTTDLKWLRTFVTWQLSKLKFRPALHLHVNIPKVQKIETIFRNKILAKAVSIQNFPKKISELNFWVCSFRRTVKCSYQQHSSLSSWSWDDDSTISPLLRSPLMLANLQI